MEDFYFKIIAILLGAIFALIGIIYKSIINSIEKNESKVNKIFDKLEQTFDNKFRGLEIDVKENNIKIKEIIARQDAEMQLINKQIALHDSEIKYLSRRLNRIEGLDSDHY